MKCFDESSLGWGPTCCHERYVLFIIHINYPLSQISLPKGKENDNLQPDQGDETNF
jgi:hypothetical protein